MNELTLVLMLLLTLRPARCFLASQGGKRPVQYFFCNNPGCATQVTTVFCNEESLPIHTAHIANCTGPPPPNTVCQHDGHAFVSMDMHGNCEFEGEDHYIDTKKCTDHSNICAFILAVPSPSPDTTKDPARVGKIVVGVCGPVLVIVLGLSVYFCKKRQNRRNRQPSDSGVAEPLREMQREINPEETSERDNYGGPGLDGGSSPSQRDHGA